MNWKRVFARLVDLCGGGSSAKFTVANLRGSVASVAALPPPEPVAAVPTTPEKVKALATKGSALFALAHGDGGGSDGIAPQKSITAPPSRSGRGPPPRRSSQMPSRAPPPGAAPRAAPKRRPQSTPASGLEPPPGKPQGAPVRRSMPVSGSVPRGAPVRRKIRETISAIRETGPREAPVRRSMGTGPPARKSPSKSKGSALPPPPSPTLAKKNLSIRVKKRRSSKIVRRASSDADGDF